MPSYALERMPKNLTDVSKDCLTIYIRNWEDLLFLIKGQKLKEFRNIKFVFLCDVSVPKFKEFVGNLDLDNCEKLEAQGECPANIQSVRSLFKIYPNVEHISNYNIFGVRNANIREMVA